MVNRVQLRQADQFLIVQQILQRLTTSDNNLFLSCSDGESLFTSKRFLGVYSKVIRSICKEYSIDEVVTLIIPFPKRDVLKMMDLLSDGELAGVTQDDLDVINELLICLGITVGDTTVLSQEGSEDITGENKNYGSKVTLNVVQSPTKNQEHNSNKFSVSKTVTISQISPKNKIDKQSMNLSVQQQNNEIEKNISLKFPSKLHCDDRYYEENQGDESKISNTKPNRSIDYEVLKLLNLEEIKCSECPEVFTSDNKYKQHWKYSHVFECKDTNCEKFGKLFDTFKNYHIHKLRHHNKSSSGGQELYQELTINDKDDSSLNEVNLNRQCKVEGCPMFGKVFNKREYYVRHMRKRHSAKVKEARLQKKLARSCKNLDCPMFGRFFSSWKMYHDHVESNRHKEACPEKTKVRFNRRSTGGVCNEPQCQKFGKTFSYKGFTSHMMRFHNMNVNIKKSYNVGDHECKECGKKFTRKDTLENHEGIHNPLICKVCDKTFARKSQLFSHMKSFHQDQVVKFQCPNCIARFVTEEKLNLHYKKSHQKSKVHIKCQVCEQIFENKKYLKTHQQIHKNISCFFCYICDKSFAPMSSLISHMDSYHSFQIFAS